MRASQLLFAMIFLYANGWSQTTFSIRNASNLGKVCSNVFELREGYLVAGFTKDTTALYQYNRILIERYSSGGDLLIHKEFGDVNNSWLVYEDSSVQLNDSTFLLAFNAWPNQIMSCGLVWFDLNCDTLKTKFIPSPNYDVNGDFVNWIAPRYLAQDNQANIYLTAGITSLETENDIGIFKLDVNGNVLWSYQYLKQTEYDICFSIIAVDDGVIVMGGSQNFGDTTNYCTEYYFKLSSSGELMWEYQNRPEFDASLPQEILLFQDEYPCMHR